MIDVQSEQLIRLEDLRNFLPSCRRGKKLSRAIAFRWASVGVRGVRLETIKVGGARFTSVEAIVRFVAAQNSTSIPTSGKNPGATSLSASARAAEALKRFKC